MRKLRLMLSSRQHLRILLCFDLLAKHQEQIHQVAQYELNVPRPQAASEFTRPNENP